MDVKCGCKGIRTCLVCEATKGIKPINFTEELQVFTSYVHCSNCQRCFPGWEVQPDRTGTHDCSSIDVDTCLTVDGIFVLEEFIDAAEELELMTHINRLPWVTSQSGRLKQDFGPKVNFKKKRVRAEGFTGFPDFVQNLVHRLAQVPCLADFRPVELCHLHYDPARGSSIDPHLDDSWLWGRRLVTVNLGAGTVLTLTRDNARTTDPSCGAEQTVRVAMNPRSLLVLSGDARYCWKHAVLRSDVTGVRLALTFRELSAEFDIGGPLADVGRQLLDAARLVVSTTHS